MIIGNQSRFAVEFELDKEYGGEWLFGKFSFWIGGQQTGDYELGTSLRDVLFQMQSIIRDNGKRSHSELFALEKKELSMRINGALFGCDENEYYQIALEETWARFVVTPPVDVFDGWRIFLVESESLQKARLIVVKFDTEEFRETLLNLGEVDEILMKAYEELDKLYENEHIKGNL